MLIHTMQLKQLQLFTNTYEEPASLPTRDAHSLHTRLCMKRKIEIPSARRCISRRYVP